MAKRDFYESTLGMSVNRDPLVRNFFTKLFESYGSNLSAQGAVATIFSTQDSANMFLETVNNLNQEEDFSGAGIQNAIMREDAAARSVAMGVLAKELLEESTTQGLAALHPISLTSFGFQIRAYVKASMHRAVKTIQAEKPAFKMTERKQFLIDISGNKRYFVDAFNHASNLSDHLHTRFDMTVNVPSTNYDIFTVNSIDTRNKLAIDISLKSFTAVEADGTTAAAANTLKIVSRKREIDIETGLFMIDVSFGSDNATATLHGQIDFNTNKLVSITATSTRVKTAIFAARLSSEPHLNALVVGMEHEHTPVNIPDGVHIEAQLTAEFTDDASRMLGLNILEEYTNQMGTAIEKIEDISIYQYIKGLESVAIVSDEFDVVPPTGYAYGSENYIKNEFHPFVERMCIRLKSELQIDDCHFRVVGNPMDIRLPNSSAETYVFKRNAEMTGTSRVDYDFAVVTSGNTIFYLSTDRVPPGKAYILLIPNTIENNISTVNHFRYANYVTNKYRSAKNQQLPTVMVSSRYKTHDYLPVLGVLTIANNYADYYS